MSTEKPQPLTPAEIDQLTIEYRSIEAQIDAIDKTADDQKTPLLVRYGELKALFLDHVRQFGSAHAEKSKILHGIAMEIMATFSTYSSMDASAIERFRLALVKAKQARLLSKIFEKTIRWTLKPAAASLAIRGNKLTPKLLALYSQITVTKDRAPTLEVRLVKKEAKSA